MTPSKTSPKPPDGIYPLSVTQGIENQPSPNPSPNPVPPPGMTCRPDWIRLVGDAANILWLVHRLNELFGEPIDFTPAKFFKSGQKWHPGVLLSRGHKSKIIMLDLQGSCLACTPSEVFMKLTTEALTRGFHCTRIDLAVDHVGMDLRLYERFKASCEAGELCKLRSFSPKPEFKADGTPTSQYIVIGKRSSPIFIRVYDKGLESGTLPLGQWERFEVEFKADRANEVCMNLASADDRMHEALWRYVIGSVDFREANGRSELARRPRVEWWSDYIGNAVPLDCPPSPKDSMFETWWGWARASFGARFLQIAQVMNISPETLLSELLEDLDPARSESPAIIDLRNRIEKKMMLIPNQS